MSTLKQKQLFLAIWAVTLFLPYAYTFFMPELFGLCAWNSFGTFYYFAGFNGYLLLGYSEQEMEIFFLYCSPNVVLMTIALFLIVRKIKIESESIIAVLANITQCGLGIYMAHYFVVGFCYALADAFTVPVSLRIPVTAVIAFAISWAFVATGYKVAPKWAKWIFG